ncbi:MAG TPA: phosphodiester glycosidase family protein [Candidatus Binatus sp.]|nr:phosphodiester glycosidase family protein [Candidatus Binatus sp.]
MRKLSTSLVLLVAAATTGRADWTVTSAQTEGPRDGVQHRHVVVTDPETSAHAIVDLAFFSAKSYTLRLIDQPIPPRRDLADVMEQERCLAGVNGGYFSPDYAPIGLVIVDGRMIAPLRRARLLTGVLIASLRGVQIMRAREFPRQQKFNAAVQCGPFLVDLGRPVRGLEETRESRRTFAAVAKSDRAALGVCSNISLAKLADILASAQLADDFKISHALNLDGGSSSGFWFAREGDAFSVPEQKTVRDFVAIVPK